MFLALLSITVSCVVEGATSRMLFDKTIPIKQLDVVEDYGLLLYRTDKGIILVVVMA